MLELTGVGGRAEFTGVSPGTSQGAAAGRAADADPHLHTAGELALAPGAVLKEAVPHAGV